jgi:hypothetical protein
MFRCIVLNGWVGLNHQLLPAHSAVVLPTAQGGSWQLVVDSTAFLGSSSLLAAAKWLLNVYYVQVHCFEWLYGPGPPTAACAQRRCAVSA